MNQPTGLACLRRPLNLGDFVETRARFWWLPHAFLPCLARQGRILALLMSFLEHSHLTEVATKVAEFPMLWRSMLEHTFVIFGLAGLNRVEKHEEATKSEP
jgi:hypothetical protein